MTPCRCRLRRGKSANWDPGGFLAFCSYAGVDRAGRPITLNVPKGHGSLLADNNTLLHEMVHQLLYERGEPVGRDSDVWRREIMRLNKLITGKEIWAGRAMTKRVAGGDGKFSKVIRLNALTRTATRPWGRRRSGAGRTTGAASTWVASAW